VSQREVIQLESTTREPTRSNASRWLGGLGGLGVLLFAAFALLEKRIEADHQDRALARAEAAVAATQADLADLGALGADGDARLAGVVDRLHRATGHHITVKVGARSVATSVGHEPGAEGGADDAHRIEAVEQAVVDRGTPTAGVAPVLDEAWVYAVAPLRAGGAGQEVIGVVTARRVISGELAGFRTLLGLTFGGLFVALALLTLWLFRARARVDSQNLAPRRAGESLARERALLEAEARYRAVSERAPEGVLVIDERGAVLSANPAAHELLGYGEGRLEGLAFERLVRPAALAGEGCGGGVRATGGPWEIMRATRLDGIERWVEVALGELPPGGPQSFLAFVRDATELVELREGLEAIRAEARAGEQSKGEAFANLSHEIRTPLTGILGMAHLLVEEDINAEQRELARHIHASARALVGVLDQAARGPTPATSSVVLEHRTFDVLELTEQVLILQHEAADRKGLRTVVTAERALARHLLGDPNRLRQILNNLVSNAIKFTHSGWVRVALTTRPTALRTVDLEVRVEDTGIGLPPEEAEIIFERFGRSGAAEAQGVEGSGLGLTISRELARRMNGDLRVEARPGGGSAFVLTVRLLTATPTVQQAHRSVQGARIVAALPVDVEREQVVDFLSSFGAEVIPCVDGGEVTAALEAARAEGRPVAMIVADQAVPEARWVEWAAGARGRFPNARPIRRGGGVTPAQLAELAVWQLIRRPIRLTRLLALTSAAASGRWDLPPSTRAPRVGAIGPRLAGRVLIAEDNPTNQKIAEVMVARMGCEVVVVDNGREAVERLREERFDVVFMDCQMPELDGFEAVCEVRGWGGRFADLPIVALTANAMPGDRERTLAAGMSDYLAKPITMEGLRVMLERWLPEGGVARAAG